MQKKLIAYAPLAWLLVIPVLNVFYGILNHSSPHTSLLQTPLDTMIPFIPAFVIPYLIWYPFTFIVHFLLCKFNRSMYYRTLIITCMGLIVCYITFYFFQTRIERPEIGPNGIINTFVNLVYSTDAPYNCFPSIHVLTSYILLKAAYQAKLSRKITAIISVTSWLIILSTLFIKQHMVADVLGGIVLSEILFLLIPNSLIRSRRS